MRDGGVLQIIKQEHKWPFAYERFLPKKIKVKKEKKKCDSLFCVCVVQHRRSKVLSLHKELEMNTKKSKCGVGRSKY